LKKYVILAFYLRNYVVLSNLLTKMSLYLSFFNTSNKKGIWKALLLSVRSHPEDPKYGEKKTYF
jgi:hypothetical protein